MSPGHRLGRLYGCGPGAQVGTNERQLEVALFKAKILRRLAPDIRLQLLGYEPMDAASRQRDLNSLHAPACLLRDRVYHEGVDMCGKNERLEAAVELEARRGRETGAARPIEAAVRRVV